MRPQNSHLKLKKYVLCATECNVTKVYKKLLNEIEKVLCHRFQHLFEPSKVIMENLFLSDKKVFMSICNTGSSSTRRSSSEIVASIIYLGSLQDKSGVPSIEWFCNTFNITELLLNTAVTNMRQHLNPALFEDEGSSHLKVTVLDKVKCMLHIVAKPLIDGIDDGRAHMIAKNMSGIVLCMMDAIGYLFSGRTSTIFVITAVAYILTEHLFNPGVCDDFMTKMLKNIKTAYKKDVVCYRGEYFAKLTSARMSHLLVNKCLSHMQNSGLGSITRQIDTSLEVFDPAKPEDWPEDENDEAMWDSPKDETTDAQGGADAAVTIGADAVGDIGTEYEMSRPSPDDDMDDDFFEDVGMNDDEVSGNKSPVSRPAATMATATVHNTHSGLSTPPVRNRRIEYLMVQRKYSLCFVEFVRGNYMLQNRTYVLKLVSNMTNDERNMLLSGSFTHIWNTFWHTESDVIASCFVREFNKSSYLYGQLRKGYWLRTGDPTGTKLRLFSLSSAILDTLAAYNEPEWGFQKGRRNINESDIECAKREFMEETALDTSGILFLHNVKPVEKTFFGMNRVNYRHIYYVASIRTPIDGGGAISSKTTPGAQQQNAPDSNDEDSIATRSWWYGCEHEIPRVEWFDDKDVRRRIRQENTTRLHMFDMLHQRIAHMVMSRN
eukprot:gene17319-23628_t